MLWASAVVCEISAPPTTPRGTSRSAPGLITFTGASLLAVGYLDLERWLGGRLVVDLQRRVPDSEPFRQHALQAAATLVAVVAGPHDDVRRKCDEARGDLPDVQVVHLDDTRLAGERSADLLGVQSSRR